MEKNCVFCEADPARIIFEDDACYAMFDAFPVNKGHTLIVPKRHVVTVFELKPYEVERMHYMMQKVKEMLDKEFSPAGYNVGYNCGEAGGQTINHCHMHIIPRYDGDVVSPRGGIRGVVPEKQSY